MNPQFRPSGSIPALEQFEPRLLLSGGTTVPDSSDFSAQVNWVYYADAAGRQVNYDFTGAALGPGNVVAIPGSAGHSTAPGETAAQFALQPGAGNQQEDLTGSTYTLSVPQPSVAPTPISAAAITPDSSLNLQGAELSTSAVSMPTIAVAANGDIYLSDFDAGSICQFRGGSLLKTITSPASDWTAMTLGPNGDLYVTASDFRTGTTSVLRYDADLNLQDTVLSTSIPNLDAGRLQVAANGDIYVHDTGGSIYQFRGGSLLRTQSGPSGIFDLALGPNGDLFAASIDSGTGFTTVLRFDADLNPQGLVAISSIADLSNLQVAANGDIYLSTSGDMTSGGNIYQFRNGSLLKSTTVSGFVDAMTLGPTGELFVATWADTTGETVLRYDASLSDWSAVPNYITDATGELPPGVSSGADIDTVKLAYSPDQSHMNFLVKLVGNVDPTIDYSLALDMNLDGNDGAPGDFRIDIHNSGGAWAVTVSTWDSTGQEVPVAAAGLAIVSGQYIEGSLATAGVGLTDPSTQVNVLAETDALSPGSLAFRSLDEASTGFQRNEGKVWMPASGLAASAPDGWTWAARFSNFANAFVPQVGYGVSLDADAFNSNAVTPQVSAGWFTGDYNGVSYTDALVFNAFILGGDSSNPVGWDWDIAHGGGLILAGHDPASTTLDLKEAVSNAGQTVTFYYRLNSSNPVSANDWTVLISHTIPANAGRMTGMLDVVPDVKMETSILPANLSPILVTGGWAIEGTNGSGFINFDGHGGITGGSFTPFSDTAISITGGNYTINSDRTVATTVDTTDSGYPVQSRAGAINVSDDVMGITNGERPVDPADSSFVALAIRHDAAFSNADLNGAWALTIINGTGTITFDGRGHITAGSWTTWSGESDHVVSGTYHVASDGTFTATLQVTGTNAGTKTVTGAVNNSKNLVALNDGTSGGAVLTRHTGAFTNADLNGLWNVVGPDSSVSVFFDGHGNLSGTGINSYGLTETETGTYSVAADGRVTILVSSTDSTGTGTTHLAGTLSDRRDVLVVSDAAAGEGLDDSIAVMMAGQSADLAVSVGTVTGPSGPSGPFLPGDTVTVPVTITNTGGLTVAGEITVNVSFGPNAAADSNDVLAKSVKQKINGNLAPGQSITVNVTVTVSSAVLPGAYYAHAQVLPEAIPNSDSANSTAGSDRTYDVQWDFGKVGERTISSLTVNDLQGSLVTFHITGPGAGQVGVDGSNLTLDLTGTTLGSSLTITDAAVRGNFSSIDVSGSLGTLWTQTSDLVGDVNISGQVGTFLMDDIYGPVQINIAGNPPSPSIATRSGSGAKTSAAHTLSTTPAVPPIALIRFDDVFNLGLNSAQPITTFMATQVVNDPAGGLLIEAPTIGLLRITGRGPIKTNPSRAVVAGDFAADLRLSGADAAGNGLGAALIAGQVHDASITTDASIGSFIAGAMSNSAVFAGVSGLAGNSLPTNRGNLRGDGTIGTFVINGLKGLAGSLFANSNVAAATIKDVLVRDVATSSDSPFGLAAINPIGRYRRYSGTTLTANLTAVATSLTPDAEYNVRLL